MMYYIMFDPRQTSFVHDNDAIQPIRPNQWKMVYPKMDCWVGF